MEPTVHFHCGFLVLNKFILHTDFILFIRYNVTENIWYIIVHTWNTLPFKPLWSCAFCDIVHIKMIKIAKCYKTWLCSWAIIKSLDQPWLFSFAGMPILSTVEKRNTTVRKIIFIFFYTAHIQHTHCINWTYCAVLFRQCLFKSKMPLYHHAAHIFRHTCCAAVVAFCSACVSRLWRRLTFSWCSTSCLSYWTKTHVQLICMDTNMLMS